MLMMTVQLSNGIDELAIGEWNMKKKFIIFKVESVKRKNLFTFFLRRNTNVFFYSWYQLVFKAGGDT